MQRTAADAPNVRVREMGRRHLFFILTRLSCDEVLLVDTDEGLTLPTYDAHVPENVGFADLAPFNDWFAERYGIDVFRRYALDLPGTDSAFFVLETRVNEPLISEKTLWVKLNELGTALLAPPHCRAFLETWFTDPHASVTMPWSRPGGYQLPLAWMCERFEEHAIHATGKPKQVKNTYVSTVLRCPTDAGDIYLKIPSPIFVREVQVMEELTRWNIAELPRMLAVSSEPSLILMKDMGGCDLTNCCTFDRLEAVARAFGRLQLAAINFVNSGIPQTFYDCRIAVLMRAIDDVLDEAGSLLDGSPHQLAEEEISRIRCQLPMWKELCAEIQEAALPDTIDHGDLRPGNIRVVGDRIIFYDWAWSAITHPFMGITGFLHLIQNSLSNPEKDTHLLRDAYLEAWRGYASDSALRHTFELAGRVKTLYGVVVDAEWLRAINAGLRGNVPKATSADAWTLRWRQFYFSKMVRRLL